MPELFTLSAASLAAISRIIYFVLVLLISIAGLALIKIYIYGKIKHDDWMQKAKEDKDWISIAIFRGSIFLGACILISSAAKF